MIKIQTIAKKLGIKASDLYCYGPYIAKVMTKDEPIKKKKAKLILVTAMTPTKAGEGKTTTSIGLTDGLNLLLKGSKKVACACLRQPSLGPFFGMKGGATGGGKASVEPDKRINVHFTGDLHAISSASLLISAVIENNIYQGNTLNINKDRIVFPRALDVNDRALREVQVDNKTGIHTNETVITAASEIMTILCLAKDKTDFLTKLGNITVAYDNEGNPIYLKQLNILNALWLILKDAFQPNLVQTLYKSPVLVHGGPFANIAHGCCSYRSLKVGLENSDYCVTEAGFGADLGGEKFMDILCRTDELKPDLTVIVFSIRALKLQGGADYDTLNEENVDACLSGLSNLIKHLENMKKFNVPLVVAMNEFKSDSPKEKKAVCEKLNELGYKVAPYTSFMDGEKGGKDLAKLVLDTLNETTSNYKPLYNGDETIEDIIEKISTEIYGAKDVVYSNEAKQDLENIKKVVKSSTSVCVAKTPLSLTDNPKVLGAPKDFTIHVQGLNYYSGANLVVVRTGTIWLMPGLPKVPQAVKMEGSK